MLRFVALAVAGLTLAGCGSLDRATSNVAAVTPYNAMPRQVAARNDTVKRDSSVAAITWSIWGRGPA